MDAELYLRLAGERVLLAGSSPFDHGPSPLATAARALVAIDAIEAKVAQRVVDDYARAAALRSDQQHGPPFGFGREARLPDQPYSARRIVRCDVELAARLGPLRVHHICLADDSVQIAATLRFSAPHLTHGQNVLMFGGGPQTLVVRDDRGSKADAHFSGGGSDTEWNGTFTTEEPLASDTAYLEIDGARVELGAGVPGLEARIETLPEGDPALRHLWHAVATSSHSMHGGGADVEPAVDALIAAGALAADDPALEGVRSVASAAMPRGRAAGAPLPEPWQSLQRWHGGGRGKAGTLIVGATPPLFDGFALAINTLESSEDGWSLEVEAKPDVGTSWHFDGGDVRSRQLAWWAADDRGHHYLGEVNGWGGGDDSGRGSIGFVTLDPKATYIDLMPTGPSQRAVIRVPLAW